MFKIEDGRGSGFLAGVGDDHRLLVNAVQESKMENLAEESASAYLTYLKRNLSAADTYEILGWLEYTGSGGFHVEKIIMTTTADASFEVFLNPTNVSGGDARVPVNTNRRSGKTLECNALTGSTTISATVDGNLEIVCSRIQAYDTFVWELQGALILPKGSSVLIQGKSATNGAQLRATLFGYEDVHG